MQRNLQCRNLCWTSFNVTEETVTRLRRLPRVNDRVRYIVFQKEICPTTNREHLQGYVEFADKTTFKQTKEIFGLRDVHLALARGNSDENKLYCTKEPRSGGPWEEGEPKARGKGRTPTTLSGLLQDVRVGKTELLIATKYPCHWLRHQSAILRYRNLLQIRRSWKTKLIVYHGSTGTGKSRLAQILTRRSAWMWTNDAKWFDGYDGHRDAIFDDFYPEDMPLHQFLKLFDRYQMQVPVKGGFVSWAPRRCFITTNSHPGSWYPGSAAAQRRIDETIAF